MGKTRVAISDYTSHSLIPTHGKPTKDKHEQLQVNNVLKLEINVMRACCTRKHDSIAFLRENTDELIWVVNWALCSSHETSFITWKEWQTVVIQTRLFGRYFLKSEWILSLQGKQLPAANDKIKGLEKRVGSWKCLSTTINLKIFQYVKTFLVVLGFILIRVIMCQCLKDPCNLVS